ncbi:MULTISPECIES: type II toxin-antitoxin system PemK/MazF family toxin [unclassified Micromonospora]|uniref:type II toxin-antitoxin system PemK/MazF family toxin n=1 Tax=Micromonospora TaxID=1873 RepID=UPI0022B69229|nr:MULTISPECIES: type II toxin-antitoxin system PemK/MazF family toxin [unclassified Micromonospora]MCZ7423232.1 type II toxin-antitoxin system PemK/MazF family toxin [Verrucosispora sp. WMMA2121]WBB90920.1 type II toxin-antitoxin system PemK/MazF family toxin [Verrucosispora sp. WMMC514]
MAGLFRSVASRVGAVIPRPRAAGPTPAKLARRRQVSALQRRELSYAPEPDGQADPGEIVWTWVPYEDDPRQGKDRPVLVVGRHSRTLFGLMLSSQQDRHGDRHWLALGPGDWDRDRRPSWVRLDRVLTMREDSIRREGAVLDRARFDRVGQALRAGYGWR